jgi:hypothetical protein
MAAEAALAREAYGPCPRTILPRSGQEVSRLGLGLSRLHYLSAEEGVRLIHAALDLGVTHFDTARLYGDGFSEAVLGRALSDRPSRATVATKLGLLPNRLVGAAGPLANALRGMRSVVRRAGLSHGPRRSWTASTARASVEGSLRALRTDRVEMLFLHEPRAAELARADELFAELGRMRTAGRIGAIGISTEAAEAEAVLGCYGEVIDLVQTPEPGWRDHGVVPDITFGAVSAGPQRYGGPKPGRDAVHAGLRRALLGRRNGCVLVGTTKPAHLAELVAVANEGCA